MSGFEWILNVEFWLLIYSLLFHILSLNSWILHNWCKKTFHFWWNNFTFDQQYLNTGLKTQNGMGKSLDFIFIHNFCRNVRKFSKQNYLLRIHSKPDRNWQELSACIVLCSKEWTKFLLDNCFSTFLLIFRLNSAKKYCKVCQAKIAQMHS